MTPLVSSMSGQDEIQKQLAAKSVADARGWKNSRRSCSGSCQGPRAVAAPIDNLEISEILPVR